MDNKVSRMDSAGISAWKGMIITLSIILLCTAASYVSAADNPNARCTPIWYCNNYDAGTCGIRECLDINACRLPQGKPAQAAPCKDAASARDIPDGYFDISTTLIRATVEKDKVVQDIIMVNGTIARDYTLNMDYLSSYTKGTGFVSTSVDTKHMSSGDFGIIIDARGIIPGTYMIPMNITNGKYSRNATVIVDVIDPKMPTASMKLDMQMIYTGFSGSIKIILDTDAKSSSIKSIHYELSGPDGKIVSSEESSNFSDGIYSMTMPAITRPGYYTLSVKVETDAGTLADSKTFTVLTTDYKETESADVSDGPNLGIIILWIAGIAISAALLMMAFKAIRRQYIERKYDYNKRGVNMFKSVVSKLGWLNKGKKDVKEDKMTLLRKSYERGFISLKEYEAAVKNNNQAATANTAKDDAITTKPKVEESKSPETPAPVPEKKPVQDTTKASISLGVIKKATDEPAKIDTGKVEALKFDASNELPNKATEQPVLEHNDPKDYLSAFRPAPQEQKVEDDISLKPAAQPVSLMPNVIRKESILDKRSEDRAFILSNGARLCSLRDLLLNLPTMPEYIWAHHTKEGRNDFATWMTDVFQAKDVAEEFRRMESREQAASILKRYE